MISTPSNLIKWYKALNSAKILSTKSYKLMTTKYLPAKEIDGRKTYMGYGIYITNLDSKHTMVHFFW